LVEGARADLALIAGLSGAPIDALVTRWGGALPQYGVGHLDRVAKIKAAVSAVDRLAVCGAAYDGVGIPACVGSGQAAATRVLGGLVAEGEWRHE
jgi:oxygen-dependent protoporphyrinogen oxidase